MSTRRINRAINVLAWVLAASFFAGFVTKFMPGDTFFGPAYSLKFVGWGYPSWFRFVVGLGELIGGILLIIPRYRFVGCLLLGVILQGAIVTHVVNANPLGESIAAPMTLLLVVIVAVASSPIRMRHLVTVTEKESPRAIRLSWDQTDR
jgi:uncharacterized membrane protein YphA (DoxX/SURF4 family)